MGEVQNDRVLYVGTDDISLRDIPEALSALGYEVYQMNHLMHAQGFWQEECEELQDAIRATQIACVVTYDFIETVAEACHLSDCIYLAWVYDAPQKEHYTKYAKYPTNYIFVFDQKEYERLKKCGVGNIYHFPLAVCTDKVAMVLENDFEYRDEISFVGQLYRVEHLEEIMAGADAEVNAALDKLVNDVQLQWPESADEVDFYAKIPESVIDYLGNYEGHRVLKEYPYMEERLFYGAAVAARVIANKERTAILNGLASQYQVSLYTRDEDLSGLSEKVIVKPGVGFDREVYGVYQKSKINLNITLHCIETGIPQRVFDVMAAGGFLITNYQAELTDYFEPGKDLVMYHNWEELQELVEYYLQHDEERKAIAQAGQRKVWQLHNYRVRMSAVMKTIENTEWEKKHKLLQKEAKYDVLIITTAKDFVRVRSNYYRLVENMPDGKLIFIGNAEVGELAEQLMLGERVGFINEDDILPFASVHAIVQDVLQTQEVPRGITGWYYQQFLKMQYSALCENDYYLVWDGDTIPCKPFHMFNEEGKPYLDLKHEYHEEYFVTLEKLFPGMHKCIEQSFISEHMLMRCDIMKSLIADIMKNEKLIGSSFYEKIIRCIEPEKIPSNSFSEFETYGTYTCFKYLNSYCLRNWHSFRYGGYFFEPDQISDSDYQWLSKDFDAISFEKGHAVTDEYQGIFTKKEYQEKFTARQILEMVQAEAEEGYTEVWEDSAQTSEQDEEAFVYDKLGDVYMERNINQAYLCYENAEFLCEDPEWKEKFREKKEELEATGLITVRKVSFVIVSYNSKYLMEQCLNSIRENCCPQAYQIVVVDNASTDGVAEWLREQRDITLILSEENLGFPKGCNVGIDAAEKQNDIFLLNNDTRMASNALFWLRMGLYEDENVGATGCVANYCGNDQQIEVQFPMPNDYLEYGKVRNVYCNNPYEERSRLCGFAMLIRRDALDKVGEMDERLSPGFFEDDDLSIRMKAEGYRLLVCHNSFIYHAGSQSFSVRNDVDEILKKNHLYMAEKWGFDVWINALMDADAVQVICNEQPENAAIRVLEIGAGSGNTLGRLKYLFPNADLYGVEAEEAAVRYGVGNATICVGDWKTMDLPFEKQFFDYIIYHNRWNEAVDEELLASRLKQYGKSECRMISIN